MIRHLTSVLDTALDKSLLLGYSSIGPSLRRHWWPDDPAPGALVGRHVVVTGASGGLGMAAAAGLARLGATVHLLGRTASRLDDAAAEIRAGQSDAEVLPEVCDVSDLDAVRSYCADLLERVPVLHGLVHNAGVMPPARTESAQGHEATLATHVLGPLLMTELLRPALAASQDARVVVVSSGGMYSAPLDHTIGDDLEYENGPYTGIRAYARTKRLQVTVAELLAERYAGDGIAVQSMHPGWADTPGVTDSLPTFARVIGPVLRTAQDGADTIVWLVAASEADEPSGRFWCDRRPRSTYYLPGRGDDPTVRRAVWTRLLADVGIDHTPA